MGLTLDSILNDLNGLDSGAEKVAAEKAPAKVDAAHNDLVEVLKRADAATKEAMSTKTAGAGTPAGDLKKVAADLANAKDAALKKEAEFYGAAVADAFISRLQQFDASATKTASVEVDNLQKLAEIYPSLVAQAIETGSASVLEKLGSDEEFLKSAAAGYADTMAEIEKIASDCFSRGYEDSVEVLQAVAGSR